MKKRMVMMILAAAVMMSACGQTGGAEAANGMETASDMESMETAEIAVDSTQAANAGKNTNTLKAQAGDNDAGSTAQATDVIDTEDMFTKRDLQQSPDLSGAEYLTVSSGQDITITAEGTYVLSGQASDVTVYVEAGSEDKVQLVLDGLKISNTDAPCIYVKSADKVFVTSVSEDNQLSVSGSFAADGDTNTDAVIFSKEDLVLNGTGTVAVSSVDNGITSKDTLKVTGGTWQIGCEGSALEAHDAIEVADGNIEISSCNDGLHAEDDEDDTVGYVYIAGGSFVIEAEDDAIHAVTIVRIDGGSFEIAAAEGIEGTVVQINDGTVNISASDDGINAAQKSGAFSPLVEINGGEVTINMGAGDTDGIDSNGDIIINGGTIDITGQSAFDYDGKAEHNGGTIIENGQETDTITNQMMGGRGGMGGFGGMEGQMGHGGRNGQTAVDGTDAQNGDAAPANGQNGSTAPEGVNGWNGYAAPPEGMPENGGQMRPEGQNGMGRPEGFGGPRGMMGPEGQMRPEGNPGESSTAE
ncbi:MAG: carbohydrate-binding domain-containing protein [Lachnospiraceae bacterium]|nr:carbohydrate-binding domain-containing protein [Lachnospiraceae bacterium]